jgi:hypothetical protein
LFSPEIKIFDRSQETGVMTTYSEDLPEQRIPTVFYGRGRGIHGIITFSGVPFDVLFTKDFPATAGNIQKGLFAVVAKDGYRCVFTFSEIFNRNDQQKFLLVNRGDNQDGGKFSLFPSSDFFSDRAVKAISEIHFFLVNDF